MVVVIDVEPIRERFLTVAPFLDERGRRLVAAAEAFAVGYGGIAAVAMATGMAPSTIGRGQGASQRFARTRRYSQISRRWSNQRHAGIRNRRCGGPARACAGWRRRCRRKATK